MALYPSRELQRQRLFAYRQKAQIETPHPVPGTASFKSGPDLGSDSMNPKHHDDESQYPSLQDAKERFRQAQALLNDQIDSDAADNKQAVILLRRKMMRWLFVVCELVPQEKVEDFDDPLEEAWQRLLVAKRVVLNEFDGVCGPETFIADMARQRISKERALIAILGNPHDSDSDSDSVLPNEETSASDIDTTADVSEDATGDVSEDVTGGVGEDVTGDVGEDATGGVVESVTRSVGEDVTGEEVQPPPGTSEVEDSRQRAPWRNPDGSCSTQ